MLLQERSEQQSKQKTTNSVHIGYSDTFWLLPDFPKEELHPDCFPLFRAVSLHPTRAGFGHMESELAPVNANDFMEEDAAPTSAIPAPRTRRTYYKLNYNHDLKLLPNTVLKISMSTTPLGPKLCSRNSAAHVAAVRRRRAPVELLLIAGGKRQMSLFSRISPSE